MYIVEKINRTRKVLKELLEHEWDISVINDKKGKPLFIISDKLKRLVKKKFKISNFDFFLSISDEKKYSIAYVILQKK